MGSSNMGVVTTDDIEAQRHNPSWFANHKHMLRPNQEGEENRLGYFILKVPEYMRQPSEAFSPVGWQFGLHNRENLDSSGSEAIKLGIAVQYGLVGEKWDHFCDAIVDDPKAMLACYGLQDGVTSWTDEQIKHVLALDALFLATFFDLEYFPPNERRLWTRNTMSSFGANNVFCARFGIWIQSLQRDLGRVENQVPIVLIDKVVDYIINYIPSLTSEGTISCIDDLQYQQTCIEFAVKILAGCFMDTSNQAFKNDISSALSVKTHVFGAAYNIICGFEDLSLPDFSERTYIHIPSATKLDQSGIKIVGVNKPLYKMSYVKKCLRLPKMKTYDGTTFFLQNMAYYETTSHLGGCLFSDYIFLLFDLIETPEDVDLLVESGVIDNACGIRAFKMWIDLRGGSVQVPSSKRHNDMKKAIVSRCKHRRYRLWSEFQIVFCSRPWLVLSTIVVVLVTLATLVQTYIAIIGSDKMKPKFP